LSEVLSQLELDFAATDPAVPPREKKIRKSAQDTKMTCGIIVKIINFLARSFMPSVCPILTRALINPMLLGTTNFHRRQAQTVQARWHNILI
jgi:hypothetical protein